MPVNSEPQNYMFAEMRSALGITRSQDILDHVYSLPTAEQQHHAMELIRNIERTAYVPLPARHSEKSTLTNAL